MSKPKKKRAAKKSAPKKRPAKKSAAKKRPAKKRAAKKASKKSGGKKKASKKRRVPKSVRAAGHTLGAYSATSRGLALHIHHHH